MPAQAARRRWIRTFAALLLMPLASVAMAQADAGQEPTRPYDQWVAQAVAILSHRPDADALVTAAMLQPFAGASPSQSFSLLDQASRLQPNAADIAALAMLECGQIDGCDAHDRARHLQALAPNNALAWLLALRTARAQKEVLLTSQILQRMASAGSFETYEPLLAKRFHDGLEDVPPPPSGNADPHFDKDFGRIVQTKSLVSTLPVPGYKDLVQACRPDDTEFAYRQSACHQIALELSRSWSMVANGIGAVLERWTARNAQQYQRALARGHELDWLLAIRESCDAVHILICLDADMKASSELDASRMIARQLGKPVMPPDTWADQRQQSSIQQDQQRFHLDPSITGNRVDSKTSCTANPVCRSVKHPLR